MRFHHFLSGLLIAGLLLPASQAMGASSTGANIKVTLYPDNKVITVSQDSKSWNLNLEAAPYNPDGVTLIPVRGVLDQLGGTVQWNAEKRQVEIAADNNKILLSIDSKTAMVNNQAVEMDRAARIINNRTMIPLRFLSENSGYYVTWDGTAKKIEIINQVVATVNGQAINRVDYEKNSYLMKYILEKQYGQQVWEQQYQDGSTLKDKFPDMVLSNMILQQIFYQKSLADKITVDESGVKTQLAQLQNAIKSDATLAAQVKAKGIDDNFLKKKITLDLLSSDYKSKYLSSLNITDEQLKTIYAKNSKAFQQEQVQASHILIKTVTEKTTEDKEANHQAYLKASEILQRVKAGEDFAALAKQCSQDPGSAAQGGDLGYFTKGVMVQEFEAAAFSMQKGQISELVKTSFGYHIIKVVDHRTQTLPFEQVSASIKSSLQNQSLQDYLLQITQAAKTDIYGVR